MRTDIQGLRVLIVEDESLVSMLIEDMLAEIGCTVVSVAPRLDEAMRKVSSLAFDVAILDVDLNGSEAYPVAEVLARSGTPFILATGYGSAGIPESFQGAPILAKPFEQSDLERVLVAALASAR
jgi:CheY-like chemotaxis protein